jgi:SAM-dependent methyltransferase
MTESGYDAATYWDDVAAHLLTRSDEATVVAGDDTPFYRAKRRLFLDSMLLPAMATADFMLEVGCGPGGNLAFLAAHGTEAVGADVSPRMLQRVADTLGIQGTLIDGRHLPFADYHFPSVFTATVLQHNTDDQAAALLAEMARVSSAEVHLFEDTGSVSMHDRPSHWLRRPSWYVERLGAAGFDLVHHERLPIACQEIAATFARAIYGRRHREGQPVESQRRRVENAALSVARVLDRIVPPVLGLTRMSFRRRTAMGNR